MARDLYAAILAGGKSERMGFPKVRLLMPNGEPIVKVMAQLLIENGWKNICLIVSQKDEKDWAESFNLFTQVALNPHPEEGMISSLRLALKCASQSYLGILAWPVDHPLVSGVVLKNISQRANFANVVVPTYRGSRGHPTWWGRALWHYLESGLADHGANQVLRVPDINLVEMETDDPAILWNIDTPAEMRIHGLKFSPDLVWKSHL